MFFLFRLLKIEWIVIIIIIIIFFPFGITVGVGLEAVGAHHPFVKDELVSLDLRLRGQSFGLIVAHDLVGVPNREGAWIFDRVL